MGKVAQTTRLNLVNLSKEKIMGVANLQQETCDRCKLLIGLINVDTGDSVGKFKGANTGSFTLRDEHDNLVIHYDVVCDRCRTVLNRAIESMSPVNRGVRTRTAKEEVGIAEEPEPKPKKPKKTKKKR